MGWPSSRSRSGWSGRPGSPARPRSAEAPSPSCRAARRVADAGSGGRERSTLIESATTFVSTAAVAAAAGSHRRLPGLERRRAGRLARRQLPRPLLGRAPFGDIDPEEFFDFQAVRPHVSLEEGLTRRIDWPRTRSIGGRPRRAACGRAGRCPPPRGRAEHALALVHRGDRRACARPRGRAGRHARGAARGRASYPPEPGDRRGERPEAGRGARARRLPLRGADRSSASSTTRAGRPRSRRRASGRPFLTTPRWLPARARRSLFARGRRARRRRARPRGARARGRRLRAAGERGGRRGRGDRRLRPRAQRRTDELEEEDDLPSGDTLAAE